MALRISRWLSFAAAAVWLVACAASSPAADPVPAAEHDGVAAPTADEHAAEAHGANGQAAGHGKPNPLEFDPDLAICTLIVFAVLLAVLWKFAWGPISLALDAREKGIADNIAAAEECQQEAKRLLAEYELKLAAARDEVRGMLEEARRDAEHTQQEIVAKARADAATEIERGKREIETATSQALKELAESSANLAVDLAGRIVQAKLNSQDHVKLIEQAMASFPRGAHQRN